MELIVYMTVTYVWSCMSPIPGHFPCTDTWYKQ